MLSIPLRAMRKLKSFIIKPPGVIPLRIIARYLPDDPVIVEAGAHLGYDTLAMSRFWPRGHIHAFEPVPALYNRLIERTHNHKNVTCYPQGLGSSSGTSPMYVSSGGSNASSSLLTPQDHLTDHTDIRFDEQIDIQLTTIDQWAAANQITRIDFLWLDLQGVELPVMKASPEAMRNVRAIHTEVYLKESYAGVTLYPEVKAHLETLQFVVATEELPWLDAGNVLFIRRDLA